MKQGFEGEVQRIMGAIERNVGQVGEAEEIGSSSKELEEEAEQQLLSSQKSAENKVPDRLQTLLKSRKCFKRFTDEQLLTIIHPDYTKKMLKSTYQERIDVLKQHQLFKNDQEALNKALLGKIYKFFEMDADYTTEHVLRTPVFTISRAQN